MNHPATLLPEIAAFLRRGKHVQKLDVPRIRDLPPALRETAERLPTISGSWNPVEIYTAEPRTLRQEKVKFFTAFKRDIVYHPAFHYDYADAFVLGDSRAQLEKLLDQVRSCKTEDRGIKLIKLMFYYKLKDDLATCQLVEGMQSKDEALIARALQYKYPGVDPLIRGLAEEDFQRRTSPQETPDTLKSGKLTPDEKAYLRGLILDAPAVKEAFEWALAEYGILKKDGKGQGFSVVIDRRATAIDVRDKSVLGPTVFVPEHTRETAERLLGLIAHEIEGHARQSWNGEKLFMFGGGPLKIDEETLYEGLAMRYENEFRSAYFGEEYEYRNLDYYVFAVQTAESGGSFYDVFCDQLDKRLRIALHIPLQRDFSYKTIKDHALMERIMESAWGTTYRVMRGHLDMQNPLKFAMAKDLAYFRGYILDHQLREAGQGHINEVTICSLSQLRVLAEFNIDQDDLAAPFKDVTAVYVQKLLEGRAASGSFQVKRR